MFQKFFSSNSEESKKDQLASDPTKTWDKLKNKQVVKKVDPIPLDAPRKEGHLRFVCISDTHALTKGLTLPAGDVLVHAGDFSGTGKPADVLGFVDFLNAQDFKHKIIIAGNHDLTFHTEYYETAWKLFHHPEKYDSQKIKKALIDAPGVTYLEDAEVTIQGIKIYGSPWQPWFYDWAFNLPRGKPCRDMWEKIPSDTDVLITHGPPLGHGDLCHSGDRAGCYDLLEAIQMRIKPRYHVFGHIHEGYGITTDGETTYVNASTCTLRYQPLNPPIIFDLPIKG